mmetsp:Transcript_5235/g.16472  ORF Transcript_5235/g.16472 Transcript_5235/m.16472 type:complete len:97 (-) Transcript_5235:34-324(-)
MVLDKQGKYNEALPFFERALRITENAHGPDHPDVARSLVYLAKALGSHGHCDEALKHSKRGLGIFERHLGPDDYNTKISRDTHLSIESQCAAAAAT